MKLPSSDSAPATSSCVKPTSVPRPLTSDFLEPQYHSMRAYTGFSVWLDCTRRGAYRFEYYAFKDCGNFARSSGFRRDPDFPDPPPGTPNIIAQHYCQQKNGAAYPKHDGVSFDRGHLVPANHLDGNKLAIKQSNFMTNIMPQAANMNRGAWLQSEEIIECFRDIAPLHVLGGVIYDDKSPRKDWFKKSHYVDNPTFFWKIITSQRLWGTESKGTHRVAWLMPNSEFAKRDQIDKYLVSIDELESALAAAGQGQSFNMPASEKRLKPTTSPALPKGCDKS